MQFEKDVLISNAFFDYHSFNNQARGSNNLFYVILQSLCKQMPKFEKKTWVGATIEPCYTFFRYLAKEITKKAAFLKNLKIPSLVDTDFIISRQWQIGHEVKGAYRDTKPSAPENLIFIVNQFEELFYISQNKKENGPGNSKADHFSKLLLTIAQGAGIFINVVLNKRSGFLGECNMLSRLPGAVKYDQCFSFCILNNIKEVNKQLFDLPNG